MKLEKNKIVMISIIVCVVLFIVSYSVMTFGKKEEATVQGNQVPVPELDGEQKQYDTKLKPWRI